jgi:hypothetical protein
MTRPLPETLRPWLQAQLAEDSPLSALVPVAGDASFRRYFRLQTARRCVIVCESPPAQEKNAEFLAVRRLLAGAGVRVPALIAADSDAGFFVLEDLGDDLLLAALKAADDAVVEACYGRARAMLVALAAVAVPHRGPAALPDYSPKLLQREMDLFPGWFLGRLLPGAEDLLRGEVWASLCTRLIDSARQQPQVFVHRDFHSRNLMCLPGAELATIDFQDAVLGPLTYDTVSLFKDCYLRWPRERVVGWALAQRDAFAAAGIALPGALEEDAGFLRSFDLTGLQRHLKVLGIFARLHLRDGKDAYLADLPRVVAYVEEVIDLYPDEPTLQEFAREVWAPLRPRLREQPWWRAA